MNSHKKSIFVFCCVGEKSFWFSENRLRYYFYYFF